MKSDIFKNAAARLIYDLVGADGYVSDRELEIMEVLLDGKYNLTSVERVFHANKISFCQALEILQNWGNIEDVNALIDELHLIAGVGVQQYKNNNFSRIEGYCSLYEAWILFAIEYALKENAIVFSVHKKEYRFSKSEIIYVENDNKGNEAIHQEIEARYEEFETRLELYGMRFIYIPKVREYLKEKRKQGKLKLLMKYVNPFKRYEDVDAQNIVDNIDNISTAEFVKDIFPETEKSIFNSLAPSFLLKINTSIVVNEKTTKVTNFIIIPIKGSIDKTLKCAIHKYTQYTLDSHIPSKKLHGLPFILHGFDRTFLNFAMSHLLNSEELSKILFNFSKKRNEKRMVYFIFGGKRQIAISFESKSMVLYLITIIYSLYDKGLPTEEVVSLGQKHLSEHEALFSVIYKKVTEKKTNLYNGEGNLRVAIKRLKDLMKEEQIPQKYWPIKDKESLTLKVPYVSKNMIFIKYKGEESCLNDKISTLMEMRQTTHFVSALQHLFG